MFLFTFTHCWENGIWKVWLKRRLIDPVSNGIDITCGYGGGVGDVDDCLHGDVVVHDGHEDDGDSDDGEGCGGDDDGNDGSAWWW